MYIASSLDGYIARKNGDIDWLDSLENPDQIDHGYNVFMEGIDTIIMGRLTYEKVLSFGIDWPYSTCRCYVISKSQELHLDTPDTLQISTLDQDFISKLRLETKKNIWLAGGGQLIRSFLELDAIDEVQLCVIPVLIGDGIPLFPAPSSEKSFQFLSVKSFETGAVMLTYGR